MSCAAAPSVTILHPPSNSDLDIFEDLLAACRLEVRLAVTDFSLGDEGVVRVQLINEMARTGLEFRSRRPAVSFTAIRPGKYHARVSLEAVNGSGSIEVAHTGTSFRVVQSKRRSNADVFARRLSLRAADFG